MRRTAEHYRQEAERCRAQALDTSDRDVKANLLDVAREYDRLSANSKLAAVNLLTLEQGEPAPKTDASESSGESSDNDQS